MVLDIRVRLSMPKKSGCYCLEYSLLLPVIQAVTAQNTGCWPGIQAANALANACNACNNGC
jgi:hypothetical protein